MSAPAFEAKGRAAVYEAIAMRRDIRRGFTMEPIDDAVLQRILVAAHQAPAWV
jgi:nitroreductase